MELHAVEPARVVGDSGDRHRSRSGRALETRRAAPRPCRDGSSRSAAVRRHPGTEDRVVVQFERGQAVLAFVALADLAAQQVRHQLLAVADAEDGGPAAKDRGIHCGAAGLVNAGGAAGDDDPSAARSSGRSFAWQDLGVDAEFANLAGDQMSSTGRPCRGRRLEGAECSRSPVACQCTGDRDYRRVVFCCCMR